MIPTNISVEHILKAVEKIDSFGVPDHRISTKYVLIFNGKQYPPKYVLSIGNTFANGCELEPYEFSGGIEANGFLRRLGFVVIDGSSDTIYSESSEEAIKSFHKTVVNAYLTAKKECNYTASVFIQLIAERGALKVAKEFLAGNNPTTGFEKLWEKGRLDLTIEASVLLPQFKVLFTIEERSASFNRLKNYGYVVQDVLLNESLSNELISQRFNKSEHNGFSYFSELDDGEVLKTFNDFKKQFHDYNKRSPHEIWEFKISKKKYILAIRDEDEEKHFSITFLQMQGERSTRSAAYEYFTTKYGEHFFKTINRITICSYNPDRKVPLVSRYYSIADFLSFIPKSFYDAHQTKDINDIQLDIEGEMWENEMRKEGAVSNYYGKRYERDPKNRARAIMINGLSCKDCL